MRQACARTALLGLALAAGGVSPASAAVLTGSTLELQVALLPVLTVEQSPDPAPVSTVGGATIQLGGGTFATATVVFPTPSYLPTGVPFISGFTVTMTNGPGTLAPGGGLAGGFGGAAPLQGTAFINILQLFSLDIPLSVVGGPGTAMAGTGVIVITVTGGEWTTGQAVVTGVTQATDAGGFVNTISATGSDQRVNGMGSITLIAPLRVVTNAAGVLGGFATLSLQLIPEPATGLLIGVGALGMAAIGRARRGER
ncbi:MAG: PEP-CTERM sorting domain-containing protein [Proteobacteria bacterium]|nr:PEP-CTERM sorting domain-containing protein [Pseudomonadota bacterium]